MKNVLRRVRWERERESDRLIRQKYLCLFLCEKVHFFPLGSFQIFTKNIRKSFRFHPSSIFFKRTRKKSKSKKIFACLVLLATIDFWIFFFRSFLLRVERSSSEMPNFKRRSQNDDGRRKKSKISYGPYLWVQWKKSEIDSPDPRPLYFFFFFFFFFFCFYHRYSCLLVVVMRVVPRDDDNDVVVVLLLLSPPLSSPSKRKRFCWWRSSWCVVVYQTVKRAVLSLLDNDTINKNDP